MFNLKNIPNATLQLAVMGVVFLLLATSTMFGILNGMSYARSQATLDNAENIVQALQYYQQDQGRYPSQDDFYNQKILTISYLTAMPQPLDVTGPCAAYTDFLYSQVKTQDFQMEFCLEAPVGKFLAGVHTVTQLGYR